MKFNRQNKKQNRDRLIDVENRLTAVRGEGFGGLGEKDDEIKQKIKTKTDLDNTMVITRGKGN